MLPDFQHSAKLAWPPPQPSLAAIYAQSMMPAHDDQRYTGEWWKAAEEDNVRRAATEARWAEEEAERQAQSRRDYEASLLRR